MAHLDVAFVGEPNPLPVPTWTPDDNDFRTLWWSAAANYDDYFDDGSHHSDNGGYSICNGHSFFHGSLKMRLEGMPTYQVQVRPYYVSQSTGSRIWTGPSYHEKIMDTDHSPAVTHWTVAIDQHVPAGARLRLEIAQMHNTNDFPDGELVWANLVARIDAVS